MATDAHEAEHHGPALKAYMVVFVALSIFTAVSFIVNYAVRREMLSQHAGFALILGVAVVKAVLVGTYFMHLIVDWGKLYYFIFPTFILGAMFIVVLLPDIVLGWPHHDYVPDPPVGNAVAPGPHK
ncbi:MAG TPA: cytochrome C oxidase subunit IV family protein [Gemmataceae bacterium]|jgi:caa(3)-type oxidase subunit IV|nr:cytochrome C oxidase subunit IV family protein [Gemmataceae bacterium]